MYRYALNYCTFVPIHVDLYCPCKLLCSISVSTLSSSLHCGRFTVLCAATGSVSWSTWRKRLVCVSSALIAYTEVRPWFGLIWRSGSTAKGSLQHISTDKWAKTSSKFNPHVCKYGFSDILPPQYSCLQQCVVFQELFWWLRIIS